MLTVISHDEHERNFLVCHGDHLTRSMLAKNTSHRQKQADEAHPSRSLPKVANDESVRAPGRL